MVLKQFVKLLCGAALMSLCGSCFADGVIHPKGIVAFQERKLIFDTVSLMAIVILPVIVMSFVFAYRFRATKRRGEYKPEWCHNVLLEAFWWGIPSLIILLLSVVLWKKTHALDPYKDLNIKGQKEVVEVVALRWKWLFIYPQEGVAALNALYLPVNKQIEFHITADAPMSSFDIPQLAGQIYAMAGMRTRLHVYSSHLGKYDGLNTQLNGKGFSEMHFPAYVVSKHDFSKWVSRVKAKSKSLTLAKYRALYQPTVLDPVTYYASAPKKLFMKIMMQYTQPNHWLHER